MSMADFGVFHENWLEQLRQVVQQISSDRDGSCSTEEQVNKLFSLYSEYYQAKSAAVERDVLAIFAAPWASSLERSLHWIAGWRPTTAFHLIYTESSILFESHIIDILRGLRTGDLGDLSPSQFRRVSELQCETVREENAITDEMSDWQQRWSDLLADVEGMIGQLGQVVKKADNLRLKTVRSVVELLTPKQAMEFLIAAAELLSGIHQLGKAHEDRPHNL